ncbi:MAG: hypothetical protein WCT77_01870 [Bacteroidota bacterium]|jgi:hypothetical protein
MSYINSHQSSYRPYEPIERIGIAENINILYLERAVYLNNNILQTYNKSYKEIIYFNTKGQLVYFKPTTREDITTLPEPYSTACSMIYGLVHTNIDAITASDMIYFNDVYRLLKLHIKNINIFKNINI